jgi:RNA polymerase sigma factor (sigma-70 family)
VLEDRLLLKRFRNGSSSALRAVYEKYANYLLTLATAMLGDVNAAEDVLHDVFCKLIQSRETIKPIGNLKGYLGTCVANRARDRIRSRNRVSVGLEATESISSVADGPDQSVIWSEEARGLTAALAQLPHEQRETILLHLRET